MVPKSSVLLRPEELHAAWGFWTTAKLLRFCAHTAYATILYGVTTKRLNEQVKRNRVRFPGDFMFRPASAEVQSSNRSQFATGSQKHRDPRFTPYVFTEHGALMAASVLNTDRAIEVSLYVVRAFVQLRETLLAHKELAKRLDELEARIERKFTTHDQAITGILEAIRHLMTPPEPRKKRPIGFVHHD